MKAAVLYMYNTCTCTCSAHSIRWFGPSIDQVPWQLAMFQLYLSSEIWMSVARYLVVLDARDGLEITDEGTRGRLIGGAILKEVASGNSTLAIMVVTCTMMNGYLEAMLVRQKGVWETVCIELGRIVRQIRFLAQHGQMWNVERRPDIYEAIMAKTITSGRHRISLAMSGVMMAWMTESGSDSTTRSN